ncbi:Man1-Src1p-C-terminal domain-containing protein [Biscogniauxia marginata]|nr:Man1-Src1p-C-terminal domain-containing protein [Biscogniauxia marginata]
MNGSSDNNDPFQGAQRKSMQYALQDVNEDKYGRCCEQRKPGNNLPLRVQCPAPSASRRVHSVQTITYEVAGTKFDVVHIPKLKKSPGLVDVDMLAALKNIPPATKYSSREPENPPKGAGLTKSGDSTAVQRTRRRKPSATGQEWTFQKCLLVFVALISIAVALTYRKAKIDAGFCDQETGMTNASSIFGQYSPTCDECPENGYCSEGYTVECPAGYKLHFHPWSLWGFLPVPPTCEPIPGRFYRREPRKSWQAHSLDTPQGSRGDELEQIGDSSLELCDVIDEPPAALGDVILWDESSGF